MWYIEYTPIYIYIDIYGYYMNKTIQVNTNTIQERKPCTNPDKYTGNTCSNETYCDNCRTWLEPIYPQGWDYYAGDICEHGAYTGGCGADYMCMACEME